jgi:hypothetical protein
MGAFDEPTDEVGAPPRSGGPGLSRRQLLGRVGGGIAGLTLASLNLDLGRSAVAAPGPISVRDLLRRISDKGCDLSHGIRVGLPNDHPYISLRAVASRYTKSVVNFCQPLGFSVRTEAVAGGGLTAYLTGVNFTGSGMAEIQYESDIARDNRNFSLPVQPNGTFASVFNLGCSASGLALWSLRATDAATGRSASAGGSYTCPEAPPPPKPPSITVSKMGSTFTVAGSGFLSSHQILVRVVDPATFASNYYDTTSDPAGKLNFPVSPTCPPSRQLAFSASDSRKVPDSQDHTGMLWSNTVTVACS